jgi:hypothetical protein
MWARLALVLGLSALGIAIAVPPADASESRSQWVTIPCDGTTQHIDFTATGFPVSTTRFVQGGEIVVADSQAVVSYILVKVLNDDKKEIIALGSGLTHARGDLTGFIQALTDGGGQIVINVEAVCTTRTLSKPVPITPTTPLTIRALIIVYFFS